MELFMSKRLDFARDFRNHQARYGLSVKDEAEWMENDADVCNGNRIDDSRRCENKGCRVRLMCDRVALR
jgi:hypothetical protein